MAIVYPVPAFQDNYHWIFHRQNSQTAFIVDPGDADPVIKALSDRNLIPAAILITHHHWDHTDGLDKLLEYYKDIPVYGPVTEKTPQITHPVKENSLVKLPDGFVFKVIEVPGHTLDHIAYYSTSETPPMLFSGDSLFAGGCGRIFEGTARQMYESLSKMAALPAETQLFCAHEYTHSNLTFANAVEPDNENIKQRLQQVKRKRDQGLPTLPSTLADEISTNPFLRCDLTSTRHSAEQYHGSTLTDSAAVLGVIRHWKDNF